MSEPTVPARAPEPREQVPQEPREQDPHEPHAPDPRADWRSWTVPDAAVAGLVAGAAGAAVVAAAVGGDDDEDDEDDDEDDDSWSGDEDDRDEVLEELTEGIAAEGAVNTATQAAWDTFNEWS